MYLPIFYYPIQEDDRATGFLIPTYGTSTLRGQSLSNAFFWAISRSQDATFLHDWFSKAGQPMGGEYRYIVERRVAGQRPRLVARREDDRRHDAARRRRAAQLSGHRRDDAGARRQAPRARQRRLRLRHRARAALSAEHLPRDAKHAQLRRQHHRQLGQVVVERHARPDGRVLPRRLVHDLRRPAADQLQPRRSAGSAKSPFYFGAGAEYVDDPPQHDRTPTACRPSHDQGLTRVDFAPTVRIPFTQWPFLTVNSTVGWRGTYWTESLVNGEQVPESVSRQYLRLQLQHHRAGLQPHLQRRRDRRREAQARHRAGLHDQARIRDRRLRPHRPARTAPTTPSATSGSSATA